MVIFQSLNCVYAPMISGLHDSQQLKKLEKLYKTTTRWIVSLGMPVYMLMILFAQKVLSLYGNEFAAGNISLVVLCLGEVIYLFGSSGSYMVAMSGHPIIGLFNGIVMAGLTIALSFVLIPKYGVTGAALAVTTSYTFVNAIRLAQVYHFLRMHPYHRSLIKPIASIIIASVCLVFITRLFFIQFPYNLIIYSIVFLMIYTILLFIMRLNQEEIELLQGTKLKFLIKFSR